MAENLLDGGNTSYGQQWKFNDVFVITSWGRVEYDELLVYAMQQVGACQPATAPGIKDINRTENIMDGIEKDMKDLESDVKTLIRSAEDEVKKVIKEARTMIDLADERFDNKRNSLMTSVDAKRNSLSTETDRKIKDIETSLRTLIQRALDNPLAN